MDKDDDRDLVEELDINDEGEEEEGREEDEEERDEEEEREEEEQEEDEEDRGDDVPAGGSDEGEPGKKKPVMIPKPRLDEALSKADKEREARIRLEERLRVLEEQLANSNGGGGAKKTEPEPVDLKALRKQKMEAIMEGDIEKAAELEEKIESEIARAAREAAVAEVTAANARQQFAEAVAEVIEAYPFLDSKSKAANQDAIEAVVALRDRFINKGDSPATALRKAAEKVGPMYAPKKSKARDEVDDEDGDDEKPSRRVLSLRERLALKRNAEAARRQPAALRGGHGERAAESKFNVADLDEEDFDKLPEKEKRRLRGDLID